MTSISAINTSTFRMPPPPRNNGGQDPMAAVAEKLNLSGDDLKSQLRDGKSLDDIATAQGVSHDDLIAAIKAGLPADKAGAAEEIASAKGMPPPPPGGGHGPGGGQGPRGANTGITDETKLNQISDLLDMDSDEVTSQASSATDLVKLLQSKGVDLSALRNVLNNGDLLDVAA
ncbi:hypothetical protein [Actinoplanes sp. NPDC049265]|uniref:hypothetical protein n=1 Tax=Actinoplanes sp. NPDC049265 TaxID=3363902 RepID=UPI0037110F53